MTTRRSRFAAPRTWCLSSLLLVVQGGCSFEVAGLHLFSNTDGSNSDAQIANDDLTGENLNLTSNADVALPQPDLLGVCPGGRAPTHAGDLAEGDLSNWVASAPMPWFGQIPPTLKVEGDNKMVARGLIAVRFTDSSDQGVLTYPRALNAAWDLSTFQSFHASVTADDSAKQNDPGWQEPDPHITLYTGPNDYFVYVPATNQLPRKPGPFVDLVVPLTGGGGWSRTTQGNPSLANINYLAFSMDSNGFGWKVWVDAVTFEPGVFVDCTP